MNKLFGVITHSFARKKRNIAQTPLFHRSKFFISILFLIFFFIYTVSPLKLHLNNVHDGFSTSTNYVGFSLLFVEHMLGVLLDDFAAAANDINADDEVLVRKKRALFGSLIRFLMLLIALHALFAKMLGFSNADENEHCYSFISEHSNVCKTSAVYLSPHSGLAPPYPVR